MSETLNPFVWELYLNSAEGQTAVQYFEGLHDYTKNEGYLLPLHGVNDWLEAQYEDTQFPWTLGEMPGDASTLIQRVMDYARKHSVDTPEQVHSFLTELVTSSGLQLSDEPDDVMNLDTAFADMSMVTLALHLAHPEVFVPYSFSGRYYVFLRIAAQFGIPLPPVPAKKEHLERWLYYAHYCSALQEFRRNHEMTVPQLLAFLNNFAAYYVLSMESSELPEPRNAWLLIGGGEQDGDYGDLENTEEEAKFNWQGSLDMRRGDVGVMYIRSPVKAVHSLCRVVEDAYEDPFFHYKQAVQLGQFQKVPRIPFRELAAAPVMAQSQHIKRNLQGMSGQMLSRSEYLDILDLLKAKGFDLAQAPQLPEESAVNLTELANERDVERLLLEPLLKRMGVTDWVRQLPVRMGRGERVYPDYAIGVTGQFPEQRVRALVEVKYRAPGERAWRDAFLQAKSYALRLGARTLLLAAAEGVRVYRRAQDDFTFSSGKEYRWDDLREGRTLIEVRNALEG